MRVDLFDFELPEDRIALRPASPKDSAKMLVVKDGKLEDFCISNLPLFLTAKDAIVFNDTKVIPAQLYGRRGNMEIECNLHKRLGPVDWRAFAKRTKRMKVGDQIIFGEGILNAEITQISQDDGIGQIDLKFGCKPGELETILAKVGLMPLPPYIASKRGIDAEDKHDYQTIFAKNDGAVAAPTASLHFTEELLRQIDATGAMRQSLTLHVGAGTFLPVKADDTNDHKMHAEWVEISSEVADRLNQVKAQGGRIFAVGTTVLRSLESASDASGVLKAFSGDTNIFITPGYKFRFVDCLITNFHLPKSTLFMLVSAFAGLDNMKAAYQYAIDKNYRFYSYGDASLLYKAG